MEEKNNGLFKETWHFLKARKAWWLAPIIVVLVLMGGLLIVSHSSIVSPFLYVLF